MSHITIVIIGLKMLTLILGGSIVYFAFKAYKRTEDNSLMALSLGFVIITVGFLLAGLIDQVLPLERNIALIIESIFTTIGFGGILYSLYK